MEQKKGILVVSFGTSHLDTLERTITQSSSILPRSFRNTAFIAHLQAA